MAKFCRFAHEIGVANFLADHRSRLLFVDERIARGDDEHWAAARQGTKDHRLGDLRHHAADRRGSVRHPARSSLEFQHSPSTAWTLRADLAIAGFVALTK